MVKAEYEVRPATMEDVEAVAVFQAECWREAYRGLVPDAYLDSVTAGDRAARWRERLVSGARRVAITWSGAEIAGVVSWGDADDGVPSLELKSLYIGSEHRGSGIAAELMRHAIGSHAAQLWVFEQNTRAEAFYRKLGFAPDGTTKVDPDTGLFEIRTVRPDQPS